MRVLLLHNIVNPHMTPVFQDLARRVELTVAYFSELEQIRSWKTEESGFDRVVLPGRELAFKFALDTYSAFYNPGFWRFLGERKWDVLVNAGWNSPSNWLALAACARWRRPHVLWSGSTTHEPSWQRTLTLPAVRFLVRHSDAFVSYGTAASRYLEELGARADRIQPGYHCVDNRRFLAELEAGRARTGELRRSLGLEGKQVILFVGRLQLTKGLADLIAAFDRLARADTALLVVGDGPLRAELEGRKNVIFTGHVALEALPAYYLLGDVLVLPSRQEIWGLVLNEAALAGLPLIASDRCGGALDLIEDGKNGFVFPTGDVARLAEALDAVLSDRERRAKMGAASRARVTTLCTPEGVAAAIERACLSAV